MPTAKVTHINYPLVTVEGLKKTFIGEMVQLGSDVPGQVVSFDGSISQVVSLSNQRTPIGAKVEGTGHPVQVRCQGHLTGQVIDPLGKPLLTHAAPKAFKPFQLEIDVSPPDLPQRARIDRQLETSISLVDSLLPLGMGQRELVVGDRKTGKTEFLRQVIKTQIAKGSMVLYAAIGKQLSRVKNMHEFVQEQKLADHFVMVATFPHDPASLIHLTPFTAMTLAEYYRDQGRDVLVIFDSLSTHAEFYRQLSLQAKVFPGRDSYPGDIFYNHARLLERAGTFNTAHPDNRKQQKSVSITCLPMAQTVDSDLTNYIVSNLISITDGHLLFDSDEYRAGRRPAINPFLSVTRVGKQTQTPLQRSINREITSFLSQYHKIENLTHFGTDLSEESQLILDRGAQFMEFLQQPNRQAVPINLQSLIMGMIWAGFFSTEDSVTLTITNAKTSLIKNYTGQNQVFIEKLLDKAENLDQLCDLITKEQTKLQYLCQN